MSISRDLFRVNTPNVITAQNIISRNLRSVKDVFPTHEEYVTFCKGIMPSIPIYLKRVTAEKTFSQ